MHFANPAIGFTVSLIDFKKETVMFEKRSARGLSAITSLFLLWTTAPGHAQSQFEQCNAVLQGDLMNRLLTSTEASSASRRAVRNFIFSLNEDQAFDVYKKEMESAKKQGQKGSLGINYFGIGGDADFDINYDRQLSSSEFKQKFNKAKQVFQQKGEQIDTSSSALASSFASYVRDPASIEAWKSCVTRQDKPGLFAFASRDESDIPALNVVWGPGDFAASFPSIAIDISLPEGASIADTVREVASGSGRSYRITYPDHKRGFQIIVNGSLRDSQGKLVNSFAPPAQVPPVRDKDIPVRTTPPPPPVTGSDCTFGKFTCKGGFVWRQARPTDVVCVTPAARHRAALENATAGSHQRRIHIKGPCQGVLHFVIRSTGGF